MSGSQEPPQAMQDETDADNHDLHDSIRIPTRVLVEEEPESHKASNHNNHHKRNHNNRPRLESASEAVIRLSPKEDSLFKIIVETAEAFARGQITLPSTEEAVVANPMDATTTSDALVILQLPNGSTLNLSLESDADPGQLTVEQIKRLMETQNSHVDEAREISQRVLVHRGKALSNETRPLSDYNITQFPVTLVVPPARRPTLRVAGGWVRDKLLGLATSDIDLAVDNLTGVQFAQLIQAYAEWSQQPHITGRHKKIGIIASNPAQSKHLETATLKLLNDMDVDIANLRAQEIYQENSRIPTVRFGTAQEDAERRDFTMNALFFNLHAPRVVEDWTRRGMSDLFHGRLVTPLEPVQTFSDDPLRVLRAIRFAVRYQFELHPDLATACRRTDIHQALHRKVSRERVGKELEGMLSGSRARPLDALNTIANLQLAGSVFCLPSMGQESVTAIFGHILQEPYENLDVDDACARKIREKGWVEAERLLQILPFVLESYQEALERAPQQPDTQVDLRLLPVAVYLLPFRTLQYQEKNKIDKSYNITQFIFQHGVKFKQSDVRAMVNLQDCVDRVAAFLQATIPKLDTEENDNNMPPESVEVSRLEAGLILRSCKELWVTCLLMASVVLIREEQLQQDKSESRAATSSLDNITQKWVSVANNVHARILELDLDLCWKAKPLLDGMSIIEVLDIPRGPQVGEFLEEQIKWMLQNPLGTKEACEDHLKAFKLSLENRGVPSKEQ